MRYVALLLAILIPCFAANKVEDGPIHEALVTKVQGNPILSANTQKPPPLLSEEQPNMLDTNLQWIPGYWAWSPENAEFVWVSGVFRRFPPGRRWIPGFWRNMNQEWVQIPGFWADSSETELTYIDATPPDPVQEKMKKAPAKSFWMKGYWKHDEKNGKYDWISGDWKSYNSNWVYVPAHYKWRPGGYVFVSSYWDYPLNTRGTAYATVTIEEDEKSYQPNIRLTTDEILSALFPTYPDYLYLFEHHFRDHPSWWRNFWGTPPWWNWNEWWTLDQNNQWALWWWWTHPGYPQPEWITDEIAGAIPPPSEEAVSKMDQATPPVVVTGRGVVAPSRVVSQLQKMQPIVPSSGRSYSRIRRKIQPRQLKRTQDLRPTAKATSATGPMIVITEEEVLSDEKVEAPPFPQGFRTTALEPPTRKIMPYPPQQEEEPAELTPPPKKFSGMKHPYWPQEELTPSKKATTPQSPVPAEDQQSDLESGASQAKGRVRARPGRGN